MRLSILRVRAGASWPEEGYFFRGDYPTSTLSHPSDMDVYHDHITAWYWCGPLSDVCRVRPVLSLSLTSPGLRLPRVLHIQARTS
jgi:hypothetical protein